MMNRHRAALLLTLLLLLAACASTGDPAHPVKFYGWRYYAFGHERYTPDEAAYARCVYRHRLPDGSRTGFSRRCRREAVRFPVGVNQAMFASLCEMRLCHAVAVQAAGEE
jgi:hypothetical protein